jgi:YegS/Rv2252/BmrU family lipid kinase
VLRLLRQQGAQIECAETGRHGEGREAGAKAALSGEFDAVVAAGGDGTVRDAAEGLLGTGMPLGLIPTGTANVLARELGLTFSAERIAKTLLNGEARTIPVGQVNGRPFLFVVGVGFDAEAVRYFETLSSRRLGRAGFVAPIFRALVSRPDSPVQLSTNHGRSEAEWVIVTRIRRYAGGFLLDPDADLGQPGFHVVRFGGRGPLVRMRQLMALASGLLRYDPDVTIEVAEWVKLEGDAATPIQVDGEVLCRLPVEIRLHPKRLSLITPRP